MIRIKRRSYGLDFYFRGYWLGTINTEAKNLIWSGYPFKPVTIILQIIAIDTYFCPRRFIEVEGEFFQLWQVWQALQSFRRLVPTPAYHYHHVCEFAGCDEMALKFTYPSGVSIHLCDSHAAANGFCLDCGWYESGMRTGFCTECLEAGLLDEYGDPEDSYPYPEDFDDEDYYDEYLDGWVDSDSGLTELEADLGNDSNGRFIGEGSETAPEPDGGEHGN